MCDQRPDFPDAVATWNPRIHWRVLRAGPCPGGAGERRHPHTAITARPFITRARLPTFRSTSRNCSRSLNHARARHDAHAVKAVPCVQTFADHWSNHLVAVDGFYHQELGPIMNRCSLSRAGEIIAKGGVTPRQMIRMWLNPRRTTRSCLTATTERRRLGHQGRRWQLGRLH